jgi:hypothetical protein
MALCVSLAFGCSNEIKNVNERPYRTVRRLTRLETTRRRGEWTKNKQTNKRTRKKTNEPPKQK